MLYVYIYIGHRMTLWGSDKMEVAIWMDGRERKIPIEIGWFRGTVVLRNFHIYHKNWHKSNLIYESYSSMKDPQHGKLTQALTVTWGCSAKWWRWTRNLSSKHVSLVKYVGITGNRWPWLENALWTSLVWTFLTIVEDFPAIHVRSLQGMYVVFSSMARQNCSKSACSHIHPHTPQPPTYPAPFPFESEYVPMFPACMSQETYFWPIPWTLMNTCKLIGMYPVPNWLQQYIV